MTLMTLIDLITEATRRLDAAVLSFGQGTTNAFDEAVWLVLWRLGLPLDCDLDVEGARPVTPAEQEQVNALIEQRISTRQPAAYLTQEAWLQGIPFYIDERAIVNAIVNLGRALGIQVIAEGVETEAQRCFLADNGCSQYQGYLLGRPMPLADFCAFVQRHNA